MLPNGLVTLHAYSFLDLFCFLDVSTGRREQLVKLRNPWGTLGDGSMALRAVLVLAGLPRPLWYGSK